MDLAVTIWARWKDIIAEESRSCYPPRHCFSNQSVIPHGNLIKGGVAASLTVLPTIDIFLVNACHINRDMDRMCDIYMVKRLVALSQRALIASCVRPCGKVASPILFPIRGPRFRAKT